MKFINKKTIKIDKVSNELDKFAFKFLKVLEKHAKYVIVSGYVAILFGRGRGTEDIDIFIEKLSKDRFKKLYSDLKKAGFWCIIAKDAEDLYKQLSEGLAIRFAEKGFSIPNFEIKFAQTRLDEQNIKDKKIKVILPIGELFVSPIEQQIAYKEAMLKSNKDLEDARHLREIFAEHIDEKKVEAIKRLIENE